MRVYVKFRDRPLLKKIVFRWQHDGKFIFDKETIGRMELLILGALKWRMRPLTPFSFTNFFVSFFKVQDPPLRRALTARATEIICKSQCGTLVEPSITMFQKLVHIYYSFRLTYLLLINKSEFKILEFRPSVIAASAVLYAANELFPLQFSRLEQAILTCSYVDKVQIYVALFVTPPNTSNLTWDNTLLSCWITDFPKILEGHEKV